ncbi:DUF6415 family natural product biosynthesis protein [Streptomyces sp. B21-083]|uniref:DUF6415 family natural product biosynthesis protein n=1 Tax=Streptomyces sp. B21-083 TaxID=3039410 RepID=UPI002FF3F702
MRQAAAHSHSGERRERVPPDLEAMRHLAHRLLEPDSAPGALPPPHAELGTLVLKLRTYLELLVPKVEQAALRIPENEIPRYCALACVGEARGKLRVNPHPGVSAGVAHARRLARVLHALCDHFESLIHHPAHCEA